MGNQHPTDYDLEGGSEMREGGSQAFLQEQEMDEAPIDLSQRWPSEEIQPENKENKDATVSSSLTSPTDEAAKHTDGGKIRTTIIANQKWGPRIMFAQSWRHAWTPEGIEHRLETHLADEANEPVFWGGKRKAPSETGVPTGNMLETEDEEGQHGLQSKRKVPEEIKETSRNQDASREQERDRTKKNPFKKGLGPLGTRCTCPECGKAFDNFPDFVTHRTTHPESNFHQCAECRSSFCSLSSLIEHQRTHTADKPSTSRAGNFFQPWMVESLQEACDRQQASSEQNHSPKETEPSSSLSHTPVHGSSSESPHSLAPVVQTNTPLVSSPFPSTPLAPHLYTSPSTLYIPFPHSQTGSFSPFLSFHQKAVFSSDGQWMIGQEVASAQVWPGQEVAAAHIWGGQVVHLPHLSLAQGAEFPQRLNPRENTYPCFECKGSFDNTAKLLLHRNECKKLEPFRCPHCNKSFYDERSLNEHEKMHARESL